MMVQGDLVNNIGEKRLEVEVLEAIFLKKLDFAPLEILHVHLGYIYCNLKKSTLSHLEETKSGLE